MPFNHYAKIKRILDHHQSWYIRRINQPTTAKTFKGEVRHFDHYYRIYTPDGVAIPYCKFQQLDRFMQIMELSEDELPIVTD